MKLLRIGFPKWSGALICVSIALCDAHAAPRATPVPAGKKAATAKAKAPAKPTPAKATPAKTTAGKPTPSKSTPAKATVAKPAPVKLATPAPESAPRPDEFADAYPGGSRVESADLALTEEAARKADALATFARGVVAEDNAETDASIEAFKRTLALDPGHTDLALKVAYELAKRNDAPGGIQVLKDAAKAAPKDPRPPVYLSQLYAKYLKKSDLALKYAEQAIAVDPNQFAGYLALYELHAAAGQGKKAEEVIERASAVKSTDAKFWVQLGDLTTRLYLKEDGTSEPAKLERMNSLYRRAAELGRDDAAIQAKAGDYFVLSRQVKEAIPFYLAALRGAGNSDEPALGNLREKLARAFLITEDKDRAIEMLEAIVAEQPMRFETYELLGEIYQQKGDMERALQNFEQTLLLDGSSAENYLRLADLYLKLKRSDKAVDTMRQARAKFPDVPQIGVSFAVTLSQAKRHTEAMTVFAEVKVDADRNNSEILNAKFYLQYGAAAEQADLIDKAAELLRESIRLDPGNSAEARNYLGYMWVDRDLNLDEAGELIRKALETDPDNGAFIDSLGWFHFKKGEYERAHKELLRALENLKEEDPVILDHLGEASLALGRTADALNYWQKSLAIDPTPKVREKLEAAKQKISKSAAPARVEEK
ncbi:MAG: tetratricopeptide repeat protein [Chthoniobacteraceae bacterium]